MSYQPKKTSTARKPGESTVEPFTPTVPGYKAPKLPDYGTAPIAGPLPTPLATPAPAVPSYGTEKPATPLPAAPAVKMPTLPKYAPAPAATQGPADRSLMAPSAPVTAHSAGQSFGQAVKLVPKIVGAVAADNPGAWIGKPLGAAVTDFAAGALGMEKPQPAPLARPAKPAATAATKPAAAKPSFAGVTGGSSAKPAAATGAAQTPVQTQTQPPAGQPPAVVPPTGPKTVDGRAGSVASGIGSHGENVYDNASIARLTARNSGAAPAAGVPAMAAPSIQTASVTSPYQLAAPQMPNQQTSAIGDGSTGGVYGGEAERRRQIAISDATLRTARTRGDRQLQAQMVEGINANFQQGRELEAGASADQLRAQTELQQSVLQQGGENARAALAANSGLDIEGMRQAGETARAGLSKPEYVTAADGSYQMVAGGLARPVLGADGQPLQAQGKNATGLTPDKQLAYHQTRLKDLGAQIMAMQEGAAMGITPDPKALASLQELYNAELSSADALLSGGQAGAQANSATTPTREQFMQAARARNPSTSDADLAAYYDKTYGGK